MGDSAVSNVGEMTRDTEREGEGGFQRCAGYKCGEMECEGLSISESSRNEF